MTMLADARLQDEAYQKEAIRTAWQQASVPFPMVAAWRATLADRDARARAEPAPADRVEPDSPSLPVAEPLPARPVVAPPAATLGTAPEPEPQPRVVAMTTEPSPHAPAEPAPTHVPLPSQDEVTAAIDALIGPPETTAGAGTPGPATPPERKPERPDGRESAPSEQDPPTSAVLSGTPRTPAIRLAQKPTPDPEDDEPEMPVRKRPLLKLQKPVAALNTKPAPAPTTAKGSSEFRTLLERIGRNSP